MDNTKRVRTKVVKRSGGSDVAPASPVTASFHYHNYDRTPVRDSGFDIQVEQSMVARNNLDRWIGEYDSWVNRNMAEIQTVEENRRYDKTRKKGGK